MVTIYHKPVIPKVKPRVTLKKAIESEENKKKQRTTKTTRRQITKWQ